MEKIDITTQFQLDSVLLYKAMIEQKRKLEELSFTSFLKFEKENIEKTFSLFDDDKDNKILLNCSLTINPYISIYEIPLYYKTKTMDKEDIYKIEKVVFYPSILATGIFRIDYYPLKIYGNFFKSLININDSFTLFEIIQNIVKNSNNQDYLSIENRILMTVRNLLCSQLIILE